MSFKDFVNKHYFGEFNIESYTILRNLLIVSGVLLISIFFMLFYTTRVVYSLENQIHVYNYYNSGDIVSLDLDSLQTEYYSTKILNRELKIPKFLYIIWAFSLFMFFNFVNVFVYLYQKYKEFNKNDNTL